jgi:hypothetical protein
MNIGVSGVCRAQTSCLEEDPVLHSGAHRSTFVYPNVSYNVEYYVLKNKVHSLSFRMFYRHLLLMTYGHPSTSNILHSHHWNRIILRCR